mmetsp:Transcript_28238/g.45439  ORF Transcript_28238/g.45439 Transcript_28238/m.45439 type:complete len:220 (+) Transcript_28238:68-727(+)
MAICLCRCCLCLFLFQGFLVRLPAAKFMEELWFYFFLWLFSLLFLYLFLFLNLFRIARFLFCKFLSSRVNCLLNWGLNHRLLLLTLDCSLFGRCLGSHSFLCYSFVCCLLFGLFARLVLPVEDTMKKRLFLLTLLFSIANNSCSGIFHLLLSFFNYLFSLRNSCFGGFFCALFYISNYLFSLLLNLFYNLSYLFLGFIDSCGCPGSSSDCLCGVFLYIF